MKRQFLCQWYAQLDVSWIFHVFIYEWLFTQIFVCCCCNLMMVWMCDECTWHYKTFLVQLYWHLTIKMYRIAQWQSIVLTRHERDTGPTPCTFKPLERRRGKTLSAAEWYHCVFYFGFLCSSDWQLWPNVWLASYHGVSYITVLVSWFGQWVVSGGCFMMIDFARAVSQFVPLAGWSSC